MNTQVTRYLQQEVSRLRDETANLCTEIATLHRYLDLSAKLYWTARWIELEDNPLNMLDQRLLEMMRVLEVEDGSLLYFDPESDTLTFILVHGRLQQQLPGREMPSDSGIAGWVLHNGGPVIVNNPRQDWRFSNIIDEEFAFMTRSLLCVPMLLDGEVYGVLELLNKRKGDFTEEDAMLLSILGHIAASALNHYTPPGVPRHIQPTDILALLA